MEGSPLGQSAGRCSAGLPCSSPLPLPPPSECRHADAAHPWDRRQRAHVLGAPLAKCAHPAAEPAAPPGWVPAVGCPEHAGHGPNMVSYRQHAASSPTTPRLHCWPRSLSASLLGPLPEPSASLSPAACSEGLTRVWPGHSRCRRPVSLAWLRDHADPALGQERRQRRQRQDRRRRVGRPARRRRDRGPAAVCGAPLGRRPLLWGPAAAAAAAGRAAARGIL